MLPPRHLVALGLLAVVLGEGAFFDWDYASMLGGDPILLVVLLAAIVLVVLNYARPRRGVLMASGIAVSLIPVIVLFVFGAILDVADPEDSQEIVGIVLFLLAIALALPPAILGFRRSAPAAAKP